MQNLNFLGIGSSYNQLDADERAKRLAEARQKYPLDKTTTCDTVADMIEQCSADLDRAEKLRASGTVTDRVIAREVYAWQTRLTELQQWQSGQECTKKLAQQQQDQFYDNQYTQLERVQQLTSSTANGSTYLIYGMIAIFVIVAGVIIVKKLKKD
jgi:hypothetical protein